MCSSICTIGRKGADRLDHKLCTVPSAHSQCHRHSLPALSLLSAALTVASPPSSPTSSPSSSSSSSLQWSSVPAPAPPLPRARTRPSSSTSATPTRTRADSSPDSASRLIPPMAAPSFAAQPADSVMEGSWSISSVSSSVVTVTGFFYAWSPTMTLLNCPSFYSLT